MEKAEYIVKFRGDYSALAKDLKNIGAETKKIEDDEVIIKLAYDGNIKEFNKVFDKISKMHPELGIQFQYNVNEKILKQEMKKLDELTELKLNIDEGKVQAKLEKLAENVEFALEEKMSKDEITKRLKNVFGYYNTAVKAGAKNINFKDIKDRLDDAFSIETDEIQDIFGEVFDLNINKPIQLFKIDKSINEDISTTQERVDDLKDSLKSLEEKGASKSGSSSEVKALQDDIKILRSDIEDMKEQLKNLSGEAFDEMTESIKKTNEQLDTAKERLKIIQDFLKNNGNSEVLNFTEALNKLQGMLSAFYKENNGDHISSFWDELIDKAQNGDAEVLRLLSDLRLLKDTELPEKINAGMVKSGGLIGDDYTVLTTKIRSDKFSGNRLKNAEELKKRLDAISNSGVNAAKILSIVSDEANNLFVEIQETAPGKMLGQIYGQTEKDWVNTDFFEATDAEILKLIVDLETLRKAGIGVELNAGNLLYEKGKGFTIIDMDLEPLKDYEETISEAQDVLFDSIRQFYELQTDESGNITAEAQTAITALDNFSQKFGDIAEKKKAVIDQLSTAGASNQQITINDAAKEATQKAADALQKAQDSNSPAELTKPLGKDFGLGYAEGIREAMPDIVEACREVVLAAYDAIKEVSDAKNGEGNNFLDNFINNLKESLDNATPTIQEKIKEAFSKIDIDNKSEKSSLSSIASEDFQSQFQNAIDKTGEYIIKVYGELIDDFKSRLQNSIDETGIYHVDIDGWLYDTFHDGLQRDIDGQEKYIIEVKGRLFDSFKEVLQEAIDGLEAFPIEVKPYMRKDGEIEEVDLPSGNHNSEEQLEDLSYGTDAYRTKVKQLTSSIVEMNNRGEEETVEYINTVKELLRLFDMFKKVADFPIGTNQAKKFEAFITNENLNAGFDGDDTTSDISKAGVMIIDRFIDSATSKFMNLDKMIDDIISRNGNVAKYVNPIIEAEDRMGNEVQEATDQARQGLAEIRNTGENIVQLYDTLGRKIDSNNSKLLEGTKLIEDTTGRLMVLYHGSNKDFDEFDPDKMNDGALFGKGAYFALTKEDATTYGYQVSEWFGNIDKIYDENIKLSENELRQIFSEYEENIKDIWGKSTTVDDFINEMKEDAQSLKTISFDVTLGDLSETDILKKFGYQGRLFDLIESENGGKGIVIFDIDNIVNAKKLLSDISQQSTETLVSAESTNKNNLSSGATLPSQINEITQAEDKMGNEAQEATNQMSEGAKEVAGNLHLITDELGNIKVFYRGLRDSMGQGLVSDRFNGATFWTDSFDLAKEYSNWTKVESANLSMINPLEIQGNGANWNNIEYLGTGIDEASKKIIEAKNKMLEDLGDMQEYAEQEGYHFKEITSEYGMEEFRRYMSEVWLDVEGFPDEIKQQMQRIKDKVEEGWTEYQAISSDETNVYGRHNTKEFVALAQKSGQYDGVIFKDIIDSASGVVRDATNVVVQFNEDKIKFIETLKASDSLNERDIDAITQNYSQIVGRIDKINQEGRTKIGNYDSDEEKAELQKEAELYEKILPLLTEYKDRLIEIRNAKVDKNNIVVPQENKDFLKNKILSSLKELYSKRDVLTLDDVANEFKFDSFTRDEIGKPLLETLTDETTTTKDLLLITDQLYEQEFKRYQINAEIRKQKNQQISDLSKDITSQYQASNKTPVSTLAIQNWVSDIENELPFDATEMQKAVAMSQDFSKEDSSLKLLSDLYEEVSESVHATSEEIKNNTDVLNENTDAQKKNSDSTNTSKKKKEPKNYSDTYNNKLSELGTKLSGDIKFYEGKGKNTEQYLDQLREINEEISAMKKLDIATEDDIKTLNTIEERIKIIEREASFAENKVANEKSVQKWLGQINDILSKNTSRKFKSSELYQEFVELQNAFKHFDASRPQNELDELGQKALETITKFKGLDESFKGGGFLSNFTHRLSDMNAKFLAQYFSWQDMIRYARQAITTVIQLNDAFIELSKVSNTSIKNLESDFQSYADIAKRIGGTITDTINATADWARLGYNVPDAKRLAEVALLYKNVGDGIDIDAANTSLISTLQGFQLEADDALSIIDKFNEVSNNFAISSGGIGEGLQRSAAAFNAANTNLSQSIALITATNEIVQDPDAVGNMWTTVSARIRGAKTELEDMGEDTEDMVESTSKLRDLVKGITGVDIMIDENTFKDIYTIITQIGEKWNDINDIDQAALLEAFAGKRQANRLAAALSNIDNLKAAYETAENSAGSAMREQENYQKGITYSINQAKAALEELSYDLVSSDFLKGLVDTGTKATKLFDKLIGDGNVFKTIIMGIASVLATKVKTSLLDIKSIISSLKGSALNIGKTILTVLGKASLGAGIAWLATTGLQLIGGFVHKLRVSVFGYTKKELEEIKRKTREAAETAQVAFKELQKTTTANAKTVNDVKDRYAELAQGVKDLGLATQSQGSLSNDEYSEFLDISNQLIDAFPQLSNGYNDNGDALTTLNGDVETITSSLNNLLNVEKQLAQVKLQEHAKDVWAGYGVDVNDASKKYNEATDALNRYQKAYDFYMDQLEKYKEYIANGGEELTFSQFFDKNYMDYNEEVEGIREIFGTDKFISESDLFGSSVDQYADKFEELYKGVVAKYQKVVDGASNDIEQGGKKIKETVLGLFQFDEDYTSLGGEDKNIINAILSSMGYDTDYHKLRKGADWDAVYKDIKERTIGFIQGLSEEDRTGLTGAYENLRNFKGSDQTIAQYKEEIQKVKDILENSNAEGTVKNAILDSLPSDSEIENKIDHLKAIMGENWNDDMENQFTANELEIAGQLELKADPYSLTEIKDEIDKIINPVEIEAEIKASAAVDSMADMKSAVASLSDLYNQTVLQAASENADSFGTFAADPATLNSIESAFDKFIQEKSSSGEDVSELNAALENFERTAVESFGNSNYAELMQDAIDELITSYVDQTDVIKNLTGANKAWSIEQLKAMGITNAEEVVIDRLTKTQKVSAKTWSLLTDAVNAYSDALRRNDTEEAESQLQDLTKYLNEAFQDDTGITFDTDFVSENIQLVRDFVNEVDGAREKLQQLAAQRYIMNLEIDGDNRQLDYYRNQLSDLIGQFDGTNIEIGASLDGNQVIQEFIRMATQAGLTAKDIQNALAKAGVKARYKYKEVPLANQKAAYKYGGIEAVRALMNSRPEILDSLTYEPITKASTASYSVPSTTGGSSGGGGGGGSEPTQPKDDTEETFDWIEVAIQRIEEEIARLDKIVENSYTSWSNRNTALVDEINKTVDAIKAQELAEEEYYRNANELQVNDGKGLNDDDYGENDYLVKEHDQKLLDEARAIWATGEYQEKVKHGLLTGDDIEKIQNKYLVETIKTYQEWINKGIAAGDAADDLRIKLGDLARTSFDHVKDEYDELIAFVTGSADIIDEKINRTEKKGYFVDKAYYHDLMALEEENYNYLAKKRDEMIKKRDEAVAAGYIEENSSEWNKMSQEIDGVTLAIEQSETKMVEYNNTLRQLDWDMFDWIEDRISRINSEAAFLVDLMSEERLVDDNGVFTAQGEATNAMYAVKYETYMRQARDYAEERKKIEADLINDPGNKELIKRREELIDLEQESIKNAQQEKEAIKSLVQEAINKAIESVQKLIDEYKTAMHEAKDLYSYQQNLKKQTENISNIRKQLSAYAGDDSEENRARVQKLQQQLEEAEQQLQETEWDKYISETEKFLDEMMEDYSETLNKKLEDIDALVSEMIEHANNNADTTKETIREETDKVGYTLTDEFGNIISGGRDQMVTDLQSAADNITTAITNVQAVIESIKEYVAEMAEYGKKTEEVESSGGSSKSDSDSGSDKKSDDSKKSDGGKKSDEGKKDEDSKGSGTNRKLTDKDYYGVALAIINGNYGWGTGEDMDSKLKAKGFDVNRVRDIINKLYAEGYVHSGAWVGRYQGITDLSPFAFNKYAKGSKRISSDQLAWTQEKGQELIFRSSDGAMLTPLNAGDKVFTAQMTDNLWELAKGRFTTNIPKSAKGNTINNSNAISITLPNVKNYEEFKTALQNDPKMTSFIQQITLGEISNGIKLNKKKY